MTNIVMLCHNRYRLTQQALTSLRDHTERGSYTLTLVDDGSTDFRTQRLLRLEAQNNTDTTLLELSNSGHVIAQMKNLGVAWSEQRFGRGDWLYLSDSDVWFGDGWLKKLTNIAADKEPQGFRLWGGQIHPFHDLNINGRYEVLDGPSWLMHWETWDVCGPFTPFAAPGPCQSEEYPFCTDLIGRGFEIGVIFPHVVVHTGLTQTDGKDAPGRCEREAMIPAGVLAE